MPMPDLDTYTEPFGALITPVEVVVVVTVHGAWEHRCAPGEQVADGLVITPQDFPGNPRSPRWRWPGWSGRTRGWQIVHAPSGLRVAPVRFLPWARECAGRLANGLSGVDWTLSEKEIRACATDRKLHALNVLLAEYERREQDLRSLCNGDSADQRYAARELGLLGAAQRPIPAVTS